MHNLSLYLVDDHNLFREGLRFLLSNIPEIKEIHEAQDGQTYLDSLEYIKPDISFIDIEMPGIDGIETTRRALVKHPDLKIIALSMYSGETYYSNMIDAGAKGFLLKNSTFDDIQKAIKDVYEGRSFFSYEIMEGIIKNLNKKKNPKTNNDITEREIEILFNICKGLSNQEIADTLFISKRTVDKHRENLLIKTGSKNTASLVIFAIKNKIFEI